MATRIDNGLPEEIVIPAANRVIGPVSFGRAWEKRKSESVPHESPTNDDPGKGEPPEKRKLVDARADLIRDDLADTTARVAALEGRVDALARMVRALNRNIP